MTLKENIFNSHWVMYRAAYDEAILEFCCNEESLLKEKSRLSPWEQFLLSFYRTCCNMMENGKDLSDKQIDIIERQMKLKKEKIPLLSDYCLTISIMVHIVEDGKNFYEKADLGDFILLLNNREDINEKYRLAFENGTHQIQFHTTEKTQEICLECQQ